MVILLCSVVSKKCAVSPHEAYIPSMINHLLAVFALKKLSMLAVFSAVIYISPLPMIAIQSCVISMVCVSSWLPVST